MTRDPYAVRVRRPWRDRIWPWIACAAIGIAVVSASITPLSYAKSSQATRDAAAASAKAADVAKAQATYARERENELRDVICGVYVPIANATVTGANSALGRTIVVATRKGALRINCPGVKP